MGRPDGQLEAGLAEVAKFVVVPGFHQPTTAAGYVAPCSTRQAAAASRPRWPWPRARFSAALRQHVLVSDAAVLCGQVPGQGLRDHPIERSRHRRCAAKAIAAWRTATKGDALATKVKLDSQVAFMKSWACCSPDHATADLALAPFAARQCTWARPLF